ncbi:MAG: methionyl-tRNA formyltransferase [Bacteroidales bacterium]|nr:methionyl-tRNA formyltransferase [Bacteroidales bacterium]
MKIGIISNSDYFIPLAGILAAQRAQVSLFYSPSPDTFINQKVKTFVQQLRIPFTEEKDRKKDLYEWINEHRFNVCFMIGYSYLIKLDRIRNAPTQLFNIHFGPLPTFRGPIPVFWQLKAGKKEIGLAIHIVNEKFDKGRIVWLKQIPNLPHYNFSSVIQLFSQLCIEGVFAILQKLLDGTPLLEIDRKDTVLSYHKRPVLKDVSIDWEKMTAGEICNLVRACNPWNKGAITFFNNREVKIMDARIAHIPVKDSTELPGTILEVDDKFLVTCCDKKILEISMLYYQDAYYPAYQLNKLGFSKGNRFGKFH